MTKQSKLQRTLESGKFTITAEIGPPKGTDLNKIREKASLIKDYVDAINITDNQNAVVHLCSQACCRELTDIGIESIFQITCRDRNRIAIQSDVLGVAAQGINNILCLTGDHQSIGNEKDSKGVFDLDSIQLLQALKSMINDGKLIGGDSLNTQPKNLFIGAAANPFADPKIYRVTRLKKKVKAGAQFIQTQSVFDIERFEEWMYEVRKEELHKKVYILAGITPLKSVKAAQYINNNICGINISDDIISNLKNAEDVQEESLRICVNTIERLYKIEGVAGIHIMAIGWESIIPELVTRSKLYPRSGTGGC